MSLLVTLLLALVVFIVVKVVAQVVDPLAKYSDVIALVAAILFFVSRL